MSEESWETKSNAARAVQVSIAALADIGEVRANNEDGFVVADARTGRDVPLTAPRILAAHDHPILMAVSDGMGGHNAGEVASAITLEMLRQTLAEAMTRHPPAEALRLSIEHANHAVELAARSADRIGMGATVVAVLIESASAHVAWVGDSRLYLLRQRQLVRLTRDQSLAQVLVDRGHLAPDQAEASPYKNVLVQAIGCTPALAVASRSLRLQSGDQLLLCSDGLTNELSDDEIFEIISTDGVAQDSTCARLVRTANQRGGHDNITVVLAAFEGDGLGAADPNDDPSAPVASTVPPKGVRAESRSHLGCPHGRCGSAFAAMRLRGHWFREHRPLRFSAGRWASVR